MARWARHPVVASFALLLAGVLLAAAAMGANAVYHPVVPPGERVGFRWWIDIPMPIGGALVVAGGVVAWWSLIRRRPPGRAGRWGFWLAVTAALMNPVIVLPTYLITRASVEQMPGDWGEPFDVTWLILCLVAIALGLVAARRDPARRGLLLVPAVIGVFVFTFALAEVLVPH